MAKHAGGGGGPGEPAESPGAGRRTSSDAPKHAAAARAGTPRIIGLVVLVAVVATAIVIVARLSSVDGGVPEASSTTTSSAPESSASAESGEAGSGLSTSPVSALSSTAIGSSRATLPSPLVPLPEAGPGITVPGILLMASPAADGSFDVLERVQLPSPISVLRLRPAPIDLAGQQFASASAAATEVQVAAGDRSVVATGATVDAGLDLPVTSGDRFELRYRLTGATVRSTPAPAGRALAAIGPLTGGVADDFPVLIIVSGDTVLGLSCPLLPLSQQSCGSRNAPAQSIERELPWRLALTSVQFDVPSA